METEERPRVGLGIIIVNKDGQILVDKRIKGSAVGVACYLKNSFYEGISD